MAQMWSSKVLLLVATIVHLVVGHEHNCTSYKIGDPVKLQCKEIDNAGNAVWGPGPTCVQVIIELSNWVESFFRLGKNSYFPLDSIPLCIVGGRFQIRKNSLDCETCWPGMVSRQEHLFYCHLTSPPSFI